MQLIRVDLWELGPRLLGWFVRRVGARALVGLGLLGLLLSSVAAGISQVSRGLDAGALTVAALLGMLLGWRLARLQPRAHDGVWAAVVSTVVGLVWASLSAGRLWGGIAQVGWQAAGLVILAQSWRYGDPLPDVWPFIIASSDLNLRLTQLAQRESAWLTGLLQRQAPFDPQAAALLWGLAAWSVGAWAGWWVRRNRQPLWAVLPAAALLGGVLAFSRASPLYLFPVLGSCLALMAWSNYEQRQSAWEQHAVDTAEGLTLDLGLWAMATVMGISSLAYLLATFSATRTFVAVQRMFQPQTQAVQQVGQSMGLATRPLPTSPPPPPGVLPRMHLIGAGPDLGERVVMVVSVNDSVSTPGAVPPGYRSAYYWRAVTYDIYTGHGWMTSGTEGWRYQPGEVVSPTLANPSQAITMTIQVPLPDDGTGEQRAAVYFDGELVSLDREFGADWREAPEGQADLFRAWLPGLPQTGDYRVQARLLLASEQTLRQADQPPPDWIAERYLALPEDLPPRVRALGQALSGSADNPYDRAKAIERLLRRYPYTLDLPPAPEGRELSGYFLFELRRGFCDYYATAMVVLARAAGLPARLAVGYAQGSYNPARQAFLVTEAEAHSWPEIYFSGVGWVVFEPTGGRPALERPAQPPPQPVSPESPADSGAESGASQGRPISPFRDALQAGLRDGLKLLAVLVVLMALGWPVMQQVDVWRLQRMAPGSALAAIYQRLRQAGQQLGLSEPPGQTPYELASLLGVHLGGMVSGPQRIKRWVSGRLSPAPAEARWLAELYARSAYSPHPAEASSRQQAMETWYALRRRIWLARVYQRLFT